MDDLQDILVRCQRFVKTNFFQFLIPENNRQMFVERRSRVYQEGMLPIRFATKFRQ